MNKITKISCSILGVAAATATAAAAAAAAAILCRLPLAFGELLF